MPKCTPFFAICVLSLIVSAVLANADEQQFQVRCSKSTTIGSFDLECENPQIFSGGHWRSFAADVVADNRYTIDFAKGASSGTGMCKLFGIDATRVNTEINDGDGCFKRDRVLIGDAGNLVGLVESRCGGFENMPTTHSYTYLNCVDTRRMPLPPWPPRDHLFKK